MSRRRRDVPGVLARHGIDPNANAEELAAALAARGWRVSVEEDAGSRQPRWRALAFRRQAEGGIVASRRASGATAAAALARLAAAVLEAGEP